MHPRRSISRKFTWNRALQHSLGSIVCLSVAFLASSHVLEQQRQGMGTTATGTVARYLPNLQFATPGRDLLVRTNAFLSNDTVTLFPAAAEPHAEELAPVAAIQP